MQARQVRTVARLCSNELILSLVFTTRDECVAVVLWTFELDLSDSSASCASAYSSANASSGSSVRVGAYDQPSQLFPSTSFHSVSFPLYSSPRPSLTFNCHTYHCYHHHHHHHHHIPYLTLLTLKYCVGDESRGCYSNNLPTHETKISQDEGVLNIPELNTCANVLLNTLMTLTYLPYLSVCANLAGVGVFWSTR